MSNSANDLRDGFYVVAREAGTENPDLPTWANDTSNPAALVWDHPDNVERRQIAEVSGAFQLIDLLSESECVRLIELSESLGYLPDAAVSLPRSIRHNDNVTWVADESTTEILWQRCADLMTDELDIFSGKEAVGLNARFRFYRYRRGDYFKPHTDGAWPGSKIVNRQLIANAYTDRWSQLSFIVFLSDEYDGGYTQFHRKTRRLGRTLSDGDSPDVVDVRTPAGAALCFPHGLHPLHCLHSSEPILSGTKYIIRSDVLFAT